MEINLSGPASKKAEFEKLVKANMKRVYFAAYGILGSHDAAMEASQEAFIRAYKHFDSFDRSRNFFTWYYKILRNYCLNFIRNRKNRVEENSLEEKEYENGEDISSAYDKKEFFEILERAIRELDPDEREIIVLKEFEGYSYKNIAEMLDLPIGTVMSRLFYARKKLADKMKRFSE